MIFILPTVRCGPCKIPGTPGADIHARAAWDLTTGSRDVAAMVIDSGIDYKHPDLAPNMWRNPEDCGNKGNGDCYGINPAYGNADPMDDMIGSHGVCYRGGRASKGPGSKPGLASD